MKKQAPLKNNVRLHAQAEIASSTNTRIVTNSLEIFPKLIREDFLAYFPWVFSGLDEGEKEGKKWITMQLWRPSV